MIDLNPAVTTTNETTTKADCTDAACYPNAWDVNGGTTGITFSNRVLRLIAPSGSVSDALALAKATTTSPAGYPADSAGHPGRRAVAARRLRRRALHVHVDAERVRDDDLDRLDERRHRGDRHERAAQERPATKSAADWTQTAQTFGAPNL